MIKNLLVAVLFLFLISTVRAGESVVFPNASWGVEGIHGPGMVTHKPTGRTFPLPGAPKVNPGHLRINEHMDRLVITADGPPMVFHRVCKDDVTLDYVSNGDLSHISKSLTVWEQESSHSGGYFHSVVFEQPGDGVFVGTHHSENPEAVIKTVFTIAPVGDVPAPPEPDEPQDEPKPNTPREAGLNAVAAKLAAEFGLPPGNVRSYLSTKVGDEGALLVRIWLDENGKALPAEREVKDPCDPRYGNVKPAMSLYVFRIQKLGDVDGYHYFVQTKVIDVETGVIKRVYAPRTTDIGGDLGAEVSNSYDGMGYDIGAP